MSNQQLTQEVAEALKQDDNETLKLLLLDQQENTINQLKDLIQANLKEKFDHFLQFFAVHKKQSFERRQNADKIRSINAVVHNGSSDEQPNLVQREIKKKKPIRLQQKFGYDFFGSVKCLMKAYGDRSPLQQSVKMMHSQIQVLFEQFIKFVQKLNKSPKISQQQFLYKLISMIFKEQWQSFEQITRQYKKATKSTSVKQEEYSSQSSSQDEEQQQSQKENEQHMSANTLQENEYLAMLTKNMKQEQYENYCAERQISFVQMPITRKSVTQLNKFAKYLDPENRLIKPSNKYLQLVSFVCCRIVRKIIFQVIRSRNQGKLEPVQEPITYEQVLKFGNSLIQQYQKRFITTKESLETMQQKAKRCFIENYNNPKFRPLFPKAYSSSSKSAQQVWQECAHYRQLWIQRWQGQVQMENVFQQQQNVEEYEPKSSYAKYILENYQHYKSKGSAYLWEKYFSQGKIDKEQENFTNGNRPRKRVKLQSLK